MALGPASSSLGLVETAPDLGRAGRAHSTFAPEIFTARALIALSAARKAVNSSGVLAMSS